ncbi:Hypothetical protein SCLAV_1668 [Streptomyces clavuligerus]|uniref:Uncharacterized protein n=1 Tax=Streptomyces clavuligerus TaxID=1901 RepID=E2Q2Z0_STRCL|nr:Hypothetical protein SCLAV_1668 [Streptomyces clavuligerus]
MPERAPTVDRARPLVPHGLRALSAFGTRGTPSAHSPAGSRQTPGPRGGGPRSAPGSHTPPPEPSRAKATVRAGTGCGWCGSLARWGGCRSPRS